MGFLVGGHDPLVRCALHCCPRGYEVVPLASAETQQCDQELGKEELPL